MLSHILKDMDILVVDDEDFSRSIVVRMLGKLGISKIRQAADSEDALIKLRCLGRVDCLILDFHMPGLNGLQLLQRVRDGSAGVDRSLPAAMLTGHGDMRLVRTAMALDVCAFLNKPIALDTLASRLNRIVGRPHEVKPAGLYAAIEVPTSVQLSDIAFTDRLGAGAPPRFGGLPPLSGMGPPPPGRIGRLAALEHVPPYARLVGDLYDPHGDVLIPNGTLLTPRLLAQLFDLQGLTDIADELRIDPNPPPLALEADDEACRA